MTNDRARDVLRELETWLRSCKSPYSDGRFQKWADALSRLLREGEWQDISTAPKDGTQIIAVCADGRMLILPGNFLATAANVKAPNNLRFPATHWMPLPAPPGEK